MLVSEPAARGHLVRGDADGAASGRLQRNARLSLAAALTVLGLWTIRDFLPALTWAVVLAIAVWPLYQKAERRWPPGRHNILLPGVFTVAIAVLFGLPFVVLLIEGAREIRDLLALYRQATTSGIPVPDFVQHLPFGADAVARWWQDNLSSGEPASTLARRVDRAQVVTLSRTLGGQIAHRTLLFFFALMTLFFVLKEGRGLVRDLLDASQRTFGAKGERIALQMVASVHGTVDGLVLVGLGVGFLMGIAYVVAGVPHPVLLGALTAVAAMVPFAVTVVFAGVGLLLLVQGSVAAAIMIVALGTVMTFVADHFVRPVLIGGTTRLPFIWVLFGILGGVQTWGLLGLFLGPALMAAVVLLWRDYTERPLSAAGSIAQSEESRSDTARLS